MQRMVPPSYCYQVPPCDSSCTSGSASHSTDEGETESQLRFSNQVSSECSSLSLSVNSQSSESWLIRNLSPPDANQVTSQASIYLFQGRGIAKASWAPQQGCLSKPLQKSKPMLKVARQEKVEDLVHMAMSAYPEDSPYAVKPPDMAKFMTLITDTQDLVDAGVPDNTSANEQSAFTRYWIPFCAQYGVPHVRPPYSDLNANQRKV